MIGVFIQQYRSVKREVIFFCFALASFAPTAVTAQLGEQLRNNAAAYNMDLGFTAPYPGNTQEQNIFDLQASYGTIHLIPEHWTGYNSVNFGVNSGYVRSQRDWLKSKGKKINLHMLVGNQMGPSWFINGNWTANQLDEIMEN